MATVTIKTAYDQKGEQYWFAENQEGETFCKDFNSRISFEKITFCKSYVHPCVTPNWKFFSLESLESALEDLQLELQKKEKQEEKIVKTIEL